MKSPKLCSALFTSLGLATVLCASPASPPPSARIVYSGGEHDVVVASPGVVGVLDTTTFSTAPSSLSIGYVDSFQSLVFRPKSKAEWITPSSISWDKDTLSFDYMTTSVSALLRIRIYILASGDRMIVDLKYEGPNGLPLIADGKWHTMVLKDVQWTPLYHAGVADGFIDPDTPYALRISLQNFVQPGVLYVDNFRIGPARGEPEK